MQRLWDQLQFARVQREFWEGEQRKTAGFLRVFADDQAEFWNQCVIRFSQFFGEDSKDAESRAG